MNYNAAPKKMLNMCILEILKENTDADHTLTQKDIGDILKSKYLMTVDRKAIKRNLSELVSAGYLIEWDEIPRGGIEGDSAVWTNFYLNREFEDSELRLLIDSLLFSKHIPYSQCKTLIEKLEGLSNKYFKSKVKHISNLPENQPGNKQLFLIIEILDEAISKRKQVSFLYDEFGTDKKKHHKVNADGIPRQYVVNPYQMVATNGRYYLIGNYDKYDDVSYYRLDRISEIKPLNANAKDKKLVAGMEHGLNLPAMMAEHLYMFGGPSVRAKFRAPAWLADQIIDWFGLEVEFERETLGQGKQIEGSESTKQPSDDNVLVSVRVNENAFFFWALQYGMHVEVLDPKAIRNKIKAAIIKMDQHYR